MFEQGTEWIRADFHLHTRKDKEFRFSGNDDRFINDYVDKLEKEKIKLGVITNHNKFDLGEFKALKRKAAKKEIFLLPGVELSVKEGASGIHCLIVFKEDDWINGRSESINQFLDEAFKGITNRENKNSQCNLDLIGTINCLETYNKDFFILMAHIEQKSGFLNELNGGVISVLSQKVEFRNRVLGFQKGRTRDKMELLSQWMGYELPFIEGSDCKSIDDIGKGPSVYIKVGEFSFDSLVLSLKDFENRISLEQKSYIHGFINSIKFIGGKLDSQKISLSPELNTLIGIRGSGKSSIIEAIRYCLGVPANVDEKYKEDIVKNILGSGGQIIIELQDKFKKKYLVKRIFGQNSRVYDKDANEMDLQISSLLENPLYFGQKDLSFQENDFGLDLLNKFVGEKIIDFSNKLDENHKQLRSLFNQLTDFESEKVRLNDYKDKLRDIQYKILFFEENGIAEKLSKQVNYQQDKRKVENIINLINEISLEINKVLNASNLTELEQMKNVESDESPQLFEKINTEILKILRKKEELIKIKEEIESSSNNVGKILDQIEKTMMSLEEEFATIRREIDIPNINPDDYSKYKLDEERLNKLINETNTKLEMEIEYENKINDLISKREEILQSMFYVYQKEIENINSTQNALSISIQYKGNRAYFINTLKDFLKGSNLTQNKYIEISDKFTDLLDLAKDVLLNNSTILKQIVTQQQLLNITEKINDNFTEMIDVRTPNLIEIFYHGKQLKKHSIGQRASALVLFILSQKNNNLIIIDQPEDDLDNQVIYKEIITKIKERKPETQFIFATHNANIPVLGDSEQVISVSFNEERFETQCGSIDNINIQNKIVDIMEGGKEAFNKRTEIYSLWKNKTGSF